MGILEVLSSLCILVICMLCINGYTLDGGGNPAPPAGFDFGNFNKDYDGDAWSPADDGDYQDPEDSMKANKLTVPLHYQNNNLLDLTGALRSKQSQVNK